MSQSPTICRTWKPGQRAFSGSWPPKRTHEWGNPPRSRRNRQDQGVYEAESCHVLYDDPCFPGTSGRRSRIQWDRRLVALRTPPRGTSRIRLVFGGLSVPQLDSAVVAFATSTCRQLERLTPGDIAAIFGVSIDVDADKACWSVVPLGQAKRVEHGMRRFGIPDLSFHSTPSRGKPLQLTGEVVKCDWAGRLDLSHSQHPGR